jgi:hypothetical protein
MVMGDGAPNAVVSGDSPIRHYLWAGLDFLLAEDGTPVLVEANKSSHMLGEYLHQYGDERPFERIAARMNAMTGPPAILWREADPVPNSDEDICFITRHLAPFLDREPVIANVEENQEHRAELLSRDGRWVVPGSLFRWWYGCPFDYERAGTLVINSNCLWMVARDKLATTNAVAGASRFRTPRTFAVDTAEEAELLLEQHADVFAHGYVLKPRQGWGGYGVQIAEPGTPPRRIAGDSLLTERICPWPRPGAEKKFWDARLFVMDGLCVGGLIHSADAPNTNYWQGGRVEPLPDDLLERFAPAAEEAVRLIDTAADRLHHLPPEIDSPLLRVVY